MKGKKYGFTLVELLIVIAIIVMLSVIGFVTFVHVRNKAKEDKVRGDLNLIYKSIVMMVSDTGDWPGHQKPDEINFFQNIEFCGDCSYGLDSGFAGLMLNDPDDPYNLWSGPYIHSIPLDPWGNEYFFDTNYPYDGEHVATLGSYGKDRTANLNASDQSNHDNILYILKQ